MDKPRVTPKDFFLWAGAMIALYASVFAFISLVFDYLNYAMPDPLAYNFGDPYSSGISYEMASLLVLFPIFLVLMKLIGSDIARDANRAQVWVRRWALYLTLFVAGAAIAGDLITLIMYFFNGDVTLRFGLKVLLILLVAGGGFLHFLADLRGYWATNPGKARFVAWGTAVLVVATIVVGFFIVGTPWQARLYRYDDQKVENLQTIQSQIVSYYQAKQKLPTTLADLSDSISGFVAPTDPQSGAAYEYRVIIASGTGFIPYTPGASDYVSPEAAKAANAPAVGKVGAPQVPTFELCASFNASAQPYSVAVRSAPTAPGYPAKGNENDVWNHSAGRVCFERTIDPELYPPLKR